MASFRKAITFKYRLLATHHFSTIPPKVSQYRNQISLANLLQRFHIYPDSFLKTVGVLKGLGFNDGVLTSVLEGFPRVTMMKESEINEKIDFLGQIGIPRYGIERVFYVFPEVLGLNAENRLKPLLEEFLELGFSEKEVREEIVKDPRVFRMELGEMSREAFKVLWKEPRLILYGIEEIEKKIEFLVNRMKYSVGCLVEVPEYLGVDFDKQIVPRYNVIEYLKLKGALGFEVGLVEEFNKAKWRSLVHRPLFLFLWIETDTKVYGSLLRFSESMDLDEGAEAMESFTDNGSPM
ncbi:Mitochodrial transcription termination factor-related protein [Corchorus capsularis]|uniref:Mitochodrial transcription termination factor-related protein n=1 Tax=Corchorus capsularis TaxID=210143 RepID=A0A1R3JTL0_COCAP|nr:Mitochodrial transcription termination factor-related protein [Corchorus capsularis]